MRGDRFDTRANLNQWVKVRIGLRREAAAGSRSDRYRLVQMRRAELDFTRLTAAFARDGLHGVSMDEVAREAGVAKPTLYRDHASKEALFAACVEAEVERLLDRVYIAFARTLEASPREALVAVATALLRFAEEHPAGFRLLFATAAHASSAVAKDVEDAVARIPDRIAELLSRHRTWPADRDPELVAVALTATCAGVVRRVREPWDRAEAASRIGALLA
jgi:AcrR family transcriptional regulator